MYYDIDSPLMNNQGEKEGGTFLWALIGELSDSRFWVGMRSGGVEQATIAQ